MQLRVRRSIRATLPVFALTAASTLVGCGGSESDGHAPGADAAGADAVIDGTSTTTLRMEAHSTEESNPTRAARERKTGRSAMAQRATARRTTL